MRVSRKFWGGMIAGGIMGAIIGVLATPRMRNPLRMGTWKPEVAEMVAKNMRRAGKLAGKWRG